MEPVFFWVSVLISALQVYLQENEVEGGRRPLTFEFVEFKSQAGMR